MNNANSSDQPALNLSEMSKIGSRQWKTLDDATRKVSLDLIMCVCESAREKWVLFPTSHDKAFA